MSLSDGLIYRWTFDEASGVPQEASGELGAAVVDGDPTDATIEAGPSGWGNVRNLEAVNPPAFIKLYDGASDATLFFEQWTITLRFKIDGAHPILNFWYPAFFFQGSDLSQAHDVVMFGGRDPEYEAEGESYLAATLVNSSSSFISVGGGSHPFLLDNVWRRLTLTNDGTQVRLYLDAVQNGSATNVQAPGNPEGTTVRLYPKNKDWRIGLADGNRVGFFAIDDIAIYDRALTVGEIESPEFLSDPLPMPGVEEIAPFDPSPFATRHSYLDIDDGVLPSIRIPISSWQATLQADRASFVQAVIPASGQWAAAISDRLDEAQIILLHAVRNMDGSEQTWEAARAPLQQFLTDRGPQRETARVVGYAQTPSGSAETVHVLRNIRSISTSTGVRVRCEYDPTVRPGHTVQAGDLEFVVAFINAYANDSDRYMDVGERPL